ncbi:hypothetical protein WR25_07740 [Diploscapter pachys]|uniref:Uncharacterized protein n=1 Tax=Diploscapter pachys TaxID=2018661 RepID=A0A2A2K4X5_9BILA|nr:hypothetical protein WR25_07740 [Diploscapter pachys]
MPIGRSRSPSASVAPLRLAALAAIDERIPAITGPMILSNVQIAATPMTPAPRKRTSPMTTPANIARPTDRPTRCPAPISANESPPEIAVAPLPTRKNCAASATTSFVCVSSAKPAETIALTTMSLRPLPLSASPARLPAPTISTSAAARPSG